MICSNFFFFFFFYSLPQVYENFVLPLGTVRKFFRKTISYPLIRTHTNNISYPLVRNVRVCAYQEVRNVSFSENFAYLLNE